tara:strand:- start:9985 stop:11229 length:1245 start_codon:yes stop_codon:yes gene_type:complete
MFSKILQRIRHPLVANSFYLYLSHFADYLLGLFILPFLARVLGAEELGRIGLAQTFGIFSVLFMEFGFPLMATRQVARVKNNFSKLELFISQVFTSKLLLIPVIIIITIILTNIVPIFSIYPHYIVLITIGAIFQGLTPSWFFQGIEKMKKIAFSKIIFRFLGFILIIFFVNSPHDGWVVLAIYSLSSICIFLYLFIHMKRIIGKFSFSSIFEGIHIFKKAKYSFLITILPSIYQNASLILLSIFINPIQLGFYFGIARIYRGFNTLYGPIGQAFYPRISSINYENKDKSKKMMINFLWFMLVVGIGFLGFIFLFGDQIISLMLGKDFLPAKNVLMLYGIVLPLTAISHVLGRQWLMVLNKDNHYAFTQFISSIVSFVTIIFTIPQYGIFAIPISMIIFELISIVLSLFFSIKK